MTRQSGPWKGKAFIQGGRKFLPDALYMPALVAIRFNPDMKARCDRLRNAGKPARRCLHLSDPGHCTRDVNECLEG